MLSIASAVSIRPLPAHGAVPGSVDSSFAAWPNNRLVQFVLTGSNDLFVAGQFNVPGVGTNCVRLTVDGALYATFAPTNMGTVTAMAVQPDGKLLAGYRYWRVQRFFPNGNLDSGFEFVPPDIHPRILPYYFWTTALAVQPDGRILVAGYRIYRATDEFYWTASSVYRLLPDGSLDSTFAPFAATVRALAVLPDERILVVGARLTLLQPNGTRDASFAAGAFLPLIDSGSVSEWDHTFETTLDCAAIQPDGRIVVGGSFTNVQSHTRRHLARVLPDGQLDLSFEPPSFEGADWPEPQVKALAVQANGRILVGGVLRTEQWSGVRSIVRLNADGSLDDTFTHLIERFDDDEERLGIPSSIVIQDEARAIIGGGDLDAGALFGIHLGGRRDLRISCFRVQPASVTLCWRSEPGHTYYIAYKPTLTDANWTPVSGGIVAQGSQASWTGLRPSGSTAFYRVVRLGD